MWIPAIHGIHFSYIGAIWKWALFELNLWRENLEATVYIVFIYYLLKRRREDQFNSHLNYIKMII